MAKSERRDGLIDDIVSQALANVRWGGFLGLRFRLGLLTEPSSVRLLAGIQHTVLSLANSLMHIPEQPNVQRRFSQKWSCFLGVEQHSRDTHKAYLRHTFW